MRFLSTVAALAAIILLLGAFPARAMRCGTSLITVGDDKSRVLSQCGEPDHVETYREERIQRRALLYFDEERRRRYGSGYGPLWVKREVVVEEWLYNFGPNRFTQRLFFENGELVHIETGEYGY